MKNDRDTVFFLTIVFLLLGLFFWASAAAEHFDTRVSPGLAAPDLRPAEPQMMYWGNGQWSFQ